MHFVRESLHFPEVMDKALLDFHFGGKAPSSDQLKPLAKKLSALWPVLAKGRGRSSADGGHYAMERALAEAYAAYYLPANALKSALILEEARAFGLSLGNEKLCWADFGCGPGTAFWGAAWWASKHSVALEYYGFEQAKQFLGLAQGLAESLEKNLRSGARARWESFDANRDSFGGAISRLDPDLVSFFNSIGEMAPDGTRRTRLLFEVIDALASKSVKRPGPRWVLIVEPGARDATRDLLELRETLRDRATGRKDVRIWLPCLDERPCGALVRSDDWCHEEVACEFPAWMNAAGAASGMRKEAMLFSYLLVSVGKDVAAPDTWPTGGARVVSQMMREKGLDQCFLCTEAGKAKARVLHSRRNSVTESFGGWVRGQVFDRVELSEKGDVLNFSESRLVAEPDLTGLRPLR